MAQSLNSKVDLTIKATSFAGLSTNGNVMVGNKAFEFYNDCLLYTSPSPRDVEESRMPSSA